MPGTNTDPNNNPNGDAPAPQVIPPAAPAASQIQDPPIAADPAANSGLNETEIAARIEKARADEKMKAYQKIDALNKEKLEAADKLAKLEADHKAAQQNLDALREGKSSEIDSLSQELKELREKNAKFDDALKAVAEESAKEIMKLEVRAYREKVLRDNKVELVELVSGNTIEEVDASLQRALGREAELKAKFGAAANPSGDAPATPNGTPAPDLASASNSQRPPATPAPADLPRPLSPDGSQGRELLPELNPQNREAFSKLPKEEYLKKRNELLAAAKRKAGLI